MTHARARRRRRTGRTRHDPGSDLHYMGQFYRASLSLGVGLHFLAGIAR